MLWVFSEVINIMGGGWAEAEAHWQRHGPVRNNIHQSLYTHGKQRPWDELFTSPCTPQAKKKFPASYNKIQILLKKANLKLECAKAPCCPKTSCKSREFVE